MSPKSTISRRAFVSLALAASIATSHLAFGQQGNATPKVDFSYAFATPHRITIGRPDASDRTLLDLQPGSLRMAWSYENLSMATLSDLCIQDAGHGLEYSGDAASRWSCVRAQSLEAARRCAPCAGECLRRRRWFLAIRGSRWKQCRLGTHPSCQYRFEATPVRGAVRLRCLGRESRVAG